MRSTLKTFIVCLVVIISFRLSEAQSSPVADAMVFQLFSNKKISNQTYLTNLTVLVDSCSVCAFLCQMRGGKCFAAQYVKGSQVCSLQLNCGYVLLENDLSNTVSVYVPQQLVGTQSGAVRTYMFFPLAKGCSPTYSANYGTQSLSNPPKLIGGPSEFNTLFSTFPSTIWFPTITYPTPTYAAMNDSALALDIFRGSFTVSFLLNSNSTNTAMPVLTLFAGSTNMCLGVRFSPTASVWLGYNSQCTCTGLTNNHIGQVTWQLVQNWMHITFSFNSPSSTLYVFVNGVRASSSSITFGFTSVVNKIYLGAVNECNVGFTPNSGIGSLACLLFHNAAIMDFAASVLYTQCLKGVLFST